MRSVRDLLLVPFVHKTRKNFIFVPKLKGWEAPLQVLESTGNTLLLAPPEQLAPILLFK